MNSTFTTIPTDQLEIFIRVVTKTKNVRIHSTQRVCAKPVDTTLVELKYGDADLIELGQRFERQVSYEKFGVCV